MVFVNKSELRLLAIETSCDETAAAVLAIKLIGKKNAWPQIRTLSSAVNSQIKLHSKMGGVVPEAAARAHVKNILPIVKKALSAACCPLSAIDYIAVTAGPGLVPSLIVGVEFAKALSLAADKQVIPVNHLEGHLYSPLAKISNKNPKSEIQNLKSIFPMVSLIVSGGHTILVLQKNIYEYLVLGQTVDDAAGEAFDKVAKLLGLPYPGGPEVSRLAAKGKPDAVKFPRPMINSKDYNFSFAGLKTAVLYYLQSISKSKIKNLKSDTCASFQQAVADVLAAKALRAVKEYQARTISLSGGVSANAALRERLQMECKALNINFFVPPKGLSTDNAEMIGLAAAFKLNKGFKPPGLAKIKADPNLSL